LTKIELLERKKDNSNPLAEEAFKEIVFCLDEYRHYFESVTPIIEKLQASLCEQHKYNEANLFGVLMNIINREDIVTFSEDSDGNPLKPECHYHAPKLDKVRSGNAAIISMIEHKAKLFTEAELLEIYRTTTRAQVSKNIRTLQDNLNIVPLPDGAYRIGRPEDALKF